MNNADKPAYPFTPRHPYDNESDMGFEGLTKREKMAAMFIQGMLSNGSKEAPRVLVTQSLYIVDELFYELDKPQPKS
jgi:hypothetical protein